MQPQERLTDIFRRQAKTAVQRGSPLYRGLLTCVADDVAAGGPAWGLLAGRAGERRGQALPLRLMAAVHRLVLAGEAPELARFYPSAGGQGTAPEAWPAFLSLLSARHAELDGLLDEPHQTNEVARAAALVLGFLAVARDDGPPLRLLELGASAGLLLNAHRYRYVDGERALGPTGSRVVLATNLDAVPAGARLRVGPARGCDRRPLDPSDPEVALLLRSTVWPDQLERLARLDAALEIARRHPPRVDRADALIWIEERLRELPRRGTTVVFQSIFRQYLDHPARERLRGTIGEAGASASRERPLAWLRLEAARDDELPPGRDGLAELRLTIWPGGRDSVIAHAGFHGSPILPAGP